MILHSSWEMFNFLTKKKKNLSNNEKKREKERKKERKKTQQNKPNKHKNTIITINDTLLKLGCILAL